MVVMMEGDRLHKHICFFPPYWLFPKSETAQTAESINEQLCSTVKSLMTVSSFLNLFHSRSLIS